MKTAIVTGGTRGIGRAVVQRLAKDGYFVGFTYRKSHAAAEELRTQLGGDRVHGRPLDHGREGAALIPQRFPFLWVDRVDIWEVGEKARGYKAVSCSEPLLQGHFPSEPVFPGVLIAEALGQTCGVLLGHALRSAGECGSPGGAAGAGCLTRLDMNYLRKVLPGQVMHLDVRQAELLWNAYASRSGKGE